jgi:type IV pilus assembly protein PilQ
MISMRALVVVAILGVSAGTAAADRDMCAANARYRGAPVDLDVKDADIHDVYRLLADVGRVNIVVPDRIKAKVTLKLRRVPWDQIACTVAAVHRLDITINGNVLLVMPREPAAPAPSKPTAAGFPAARPAGR